LTYETFFGLNEKPFSLSSDPRFLYRSRSHALAFDDLLTGIRRREGLMVLTGDIGTGKTTLCRAALESLDRKTFVAFVRDPFASREDLLKMLLIDFGVMSIGDLTTGPLRGASRTELSYLLSAFLKTLGSLEAFVVVIIDEAQNMSLPLIEEIRILSDTYSSTSLLQIVFVGQLELLDKLKLPEMRQVEQRVCVHARLDPLGDEAVPGYVQHRLHVAGGRPDRVRFTSDALDILARGSRGVPRLINRICDRALYLAWLKRSGVVDAHMLQAAMDYVGHSAPSAALPATTQRSTAREQPVNPAQGPTPAATAPAKPVITPQKVEPAPQFADPVDEWLARDEVAKPEAAVRQFASEDVALRRKIVPPTSFHQRPPRRTHWRDGSGERIRSQTYMQGLGRSLTKKLSIAAVVLIGIAGVVTGATYISDALASLAEPVAPPLPPVRPVVVPAVTPPLAPVTEPGASGPYRVEVALFTSNAGAGRAVAELMEAGLPARQQPLTLGSGGTMQQVVLGPFETRDEAETHLSRVRATGGYRDARIVAQGSAEK
jgi:general secretion pathway protein A